MACRTIIPNRGPNKGQETFSVLYNDLESAFLAISSAGREHYMKKDFTKAEKQASDMYRRVFEDDFLDKFGDWMDLQADNVAIMGIPREKFEKLYLDRNGEPKLDALYHGGITELKDRLDALKKLHATLKKDKEAADLLERQIKWNQKVSDAQTISQEGMSAIVEKLEKRFGFKAKIIDDRFRKWAGKFVADTPVINTAYAKKDTAFHEFAHPWVEAIFEQNPALFNSLKKELLTSKEGQKVLAKVRKRYSNLSGNNLYKEAIVTSIGEYAAGMVDSKGKLYDLVFELLTRLKDLFRRLYNSNEVIRPEDLAGMSLQKLAGIMAAGDAKIATNIREFKNSPAMVTKKNLLKRLQNDGIITPGQVQGYYGIVDTKNDSTARDKSVLAANIKKVEQLERDFPGLIRRVGNDVRFDWDAPVENFTHNAQYQVIEESKPDTKASLDMVTETNTIAELEELKRREKLQLSKDESEYHGISGAFQRLTHFVKVGILGHKSDTVDSAFAADKMFEKNKKDKEVDTILIDGKELTYQDVLNNFQKKSVNATARGKAVHKIMEFEMNGSASVLAELDEIKKAKPDQDEITDYSLNWVRNVANSVLRRAGISPESDIMKAELMLHSSILNIATQIDGLVQHEDGSLTMVDWKSGSYFLNDQSTSEIMRYSTGTLSDMPNSKINKAMLELTLRAMMVKEHIPDATFRKIFVQHLDINNPFKAPLEVHIQDYLTVIGNYLRAERPEMYAKAEEAGLLDHKRYTTHRVRNSSVLSKYKDLPIDRQIDALEREIEIVRTRLKTQGMSNDIESDKQLLESLSNEYLNLTKTSKESLDSEQKLGMLKAWSSSIYNIASPRLQAFNKIFRRQSNKVNQRLEDEKRTAEVLFKAVRDEYLEKNPDSKIIGLATLGVRSGFDYRGMYAFAYEERLDGVQTPGTYMISLEDATKKYERRELSKAQFDLIKHLRRTWESNWNELMTKSMEDGRSYSETLALHNVDNAVIDGKLHANFMPRIPMANNEAFERYRGQGAIKRQTAGAYEYMKMWAARNFSLFIEQDYYSQGDVINNHIPVRFMGSQGIIADEIHSFNLEDMHYQFTANLMRKQEMDFVVALGDGLKNYYTRMKSLTDIKDKGWNNYEKFMENFVINAVMQERAAGRGADQHWTGKQWPVQNPFYDPNKPKSVFNRSVYSISPFKLLMALKHFTTAKALWFKVIGGTFNGAIILMYTVMKGMQGSTAKRFGPLLGGKIDPGAIDVTMSDIGKASLDVASMWGAQMKAAVDNKPVNNKLFNLMKRTKYMPDNYDYAIDQSDMVSVKNPLLTSDKLFFFHAIHEEWGHAIYLSAQMKRIKMQDGTSIWDNYNDDGTFMKYKNGKRNIRGIITDPSGQKQIIDELTTDELNRLLKSSTDIHGAYRTHERTVLESTAAGVWFLQFKKYLPALLMQEWESRKDDVNLGQYDKLTDENGNMIKQEIEVELEDGTKVMQEVNVMDWISWQHEGRARVLAKTIAGSVFRSDQYTNYRWDELNDRDKVDLVGIAAKGMTFILMYFALAGFDEDEDDALFQRLKFLQNDALQGLEPSELLRTLKNPLPVLNHMNNLLMDLESGNVLKSVRKDLPFFSVAYEMERYGLTTRDF